MNAVIKLTFLDCTSYGTLNATSSIVSLTIGAEYSGHTFWSLTCLSMMTGWGTTTSGQDDYSPSIGEA
jgi:hypothetical protein